LLADAEPDQRWPRVARLGDRVVIAWDESTGKQTALMAAIFDPKERRIVAGPVEVARDYANARGDELAVASDGRNIAIAWSTDTESQLVLLSPDLQTVATRFLSYDERVHDVVWDGSAYVVAQGWKELAISRWDSTLKGLGSFSLGVDSVNGYWWVDGRLLLGTTDVLLLAHNWYQLLCYCGEGPWHIAVQRLSRFDTPSSWPQTLATLELGDVKRKMSGFARAGDHLLFFFPQRTEVRALDTLALLTTLPNDALPSELPYASLGQAAVVGNQIVGTFGNLIEFFELDGTPVSTLPLDDTANDSQFAAGTPFVIVNDALASSGSRRIHLRLLDLDLPLPHRRAAAH
jgi:hypothetical protein